MLRNFQFRLAKSRILQNLNLSLNTRRYLVQSSLLAKEKVNPEIEAFLKEIQRPLKNELIVPIDLAAIQSTQRANIFNPSEYRYTGPLSELKKLGFLESLIQNSANTPEHLMRLRANLQFWHPSFRQLDASLPELSVLNQMNDSDLWNHFKKSREKWETGVLQALHAFAQKNDLRLKSTNPYEFTAWMFNNNITAEVFVKKYPGFQSYVEEDLLAKFYNDLSEAFDSSYIDSTGTLNSVVQQIQTMASKWDPAKYSAPYSSFLQSSGVGKSRTIAEYGRNGHSWLFYACFRHKNSSGYPPRTPFIGDLLQHVEHPFLPHILSGYEQIQQNGKFDFLVYASVLSGVLRYLRLDFQNFVQSHREGSPNEIATAHMKHWASMQFDPNTSPTFYFEVFEHAMCLLRGSIEHDLSGVLHKPNLDMEIVRIGLMQLKKQSSLLQETLCQQKIRTSDFAPVLFAFDEASNLLVTPKKAERSCFRTLRYVLNQLPPGTSPNQLQYFAVVCDTMGRLANFIPTVEKDQSFRFVQSTRLFDPILDFRNCNLFGEPSGLVSTYEQKCEAALNVGRPLWRSLSHPTETIDARVRNAVHVCRFKLTNTTTEEALQGMSAEGDVALKKPTMTQALAVLAARFDVYLHESSKISQEISRSHLGMCHGIDRKNDRFYTRYVTESIVGLAAQSLMSEYPLYSYENLLPVLVESLNSSLVSIGDRGELASAIILMEAYDRAVGNDLQRAVMGVSIEAFFASLLSKECFGQLEDSIRFTGKWDQWKKLRTATVRMMQAGKLEYGPQMKDLVRFHNAGLYASLDLNRAGNDFATALDMDGAPTAFLTSVKNRADNMAKSEVTWASSLFASDIIQSTTRPNTDDDMTVRELTEHPYLVLLHNVCPQETLKFSNRDPVQVILPNESLKNLAVKRVQEFRKSTSKIKIKSPAPKAYMTIIDSNYYAVEPSPDQLVINISGYNYGAREQLDGKQKSVYGSSSKFLELVQQIARIPPRPVTIKPETVYNLDPYKNTLNGSDSKKTSCDGRQMPSGSYFNMRIANNIQYFGRRFLASCASTEDRNNRFHDWWWEQSPVGLTMFPD